MRVKKRWLLKTSRDLLEAKKCAIPLFQACKFSDRVRQNFPPRLSCPVVWMARAALLKESGRCCLVEMQIETALFYRFLKEIEPCGRIGRIAHHKRLDVYFGSLLLTLGGARLRSLNCLTSSVASSSDDWPLLIFILMTSLARIQLRSRIF